MSQTIPMLRIFFCIMSSMFASVHLAIKQKQSCGLRDCLVHPPRVLCLSCPATCHVTNNPNATHILLYYVKYVCKRPSCHKTKTILRIAGLFGASAESRTRNLPRRRRLFYPVELRVRAYIFYIVLGVFASEILREFCARQGSGVVIE